MGITVFFCNNLIRSWREADYSVENTKQKKMRENRGDTK
jgi:hypothetical protein